jgi:hypothetical protein
MATSGDISWELSRNDLIEAAYRKLGIPGEGNTLTNTQYEDGAEALNAVIALAVTDGMALWKRTTTALTPSISSQEYTITGAVKISQVVLQDISSGSQYELEPKVLNDFLRLPTGTTGVPVSWMWQPSLAGGTLKIWPSLSDATTVAGKSILVTYQKEFDGFTATTTHTLDMPAYWTQAIIYTLAVALAPENGVPINDRGLLLQESKLYWDKASDYGDDDGSLYIQPSRTRW